LHRPAFFPAPAFALKLALGEFSSVLLASQRVNPKKLIDIGFPFQYPTLTHALDSIL
jgi:NAD dependent epimerase/dehydratase family enzyme